MIPGVGGVAGGGVVATIGAGRAVGAVATGRCGRARRWRRLEYGRTEVSGCAVVDAGALTTASCARAPDPAADQSASMAAMKAAAGETRDVNDVPWVKRKLLGFV